MNAYLLQAMGLIFRDVKTDNRYTSDPFSYLHEKYSLTPNLQVRASYTKDLGRPDISQHRMASPDALEELRDERDVPELPSAARWVTHQ